MVFPARRIAPELLPVPTVTALLIVPTPSSVPVLTCTAPGPVAEPVVFLTTSAPLRIVVPPGARSHRLCLTMNSGSAGAAYGYAYAKMGPYNGGQADTCECPTLISIASSSPITLVAARVREERYLGLIQWALFVIAAWSFAWPVYRAFLNVEIQNNEGWNAYFADAAIGKVPLYPSPGQFITNNYPPLSFYIVGLVGRLVGDPVLAGRLLSLVAVIAIATAIVLTGRLARRRGC